jgi:hypothetical protein
MAAVVAFVSPASAQEAAVPKATTGEPKRIALEYRRDPHAAVHVEIAAPGAVPDVPDDLKVSPPVAASKAQAQRRAVPKGAPADPERLGAGAGEAMAIEAAREWGWRQYWRAGFQRGMRDALDDSRPGRWNSNEGYRYGSLDPRAPSLGRELAEDAAGEAAGRSASEAVRAMFTDLTREPRRGVSLGRRSGVPGGWMPTGPWAEAPVFDEVFVAIPFAATPGLDREGRGALDGWKVLPAVLAREAQSSRAYDAAWKDAGHALQVWRDRQRPGSYWTRFGPGDRERFRNAFVASFDDTMGDLDLRPTYAGFRAGYADGWRYGTAVNAEWSYRQGYAAGFDNAVRTTTVLAYPLMFDRAYAYTYDEEFTRWAGNAVPALDGLRLTDGNDDGVIEPGEGIALEGEVINYGGAPGTFDVRVDGTVLDSPAAAAVRLPARSRTPLAPVALRIGQGVAPRTDAALSVTIADDRQSVAVYVSRPLEIEGDAMVDAEPLLGRVRIVLTIANRSRVPLNAEATVGALDAHTGDDRTDAIRVPAGGTVRTEATYEGLRPLDVLGGTPRWKANVRHEGVDDDSRVITIVPASTNLADPDLLTYMIDLARSPQPGRRDIAEARALLLDRMRADWDRACAMDGNPYKRDYEVGSAETALGELVRVVAAERASFASRAVFAGVGSDIASLAENLPGTHPLLRKWMRRLAKRV